MKRIYYLTVYLPDGQRMTAQFDSHKAARSWLWFNIVGYDRADEIRVSIQQRKVANP